MDFEAFKILPAGEGETTPVYDQMLAVLLEEQEILRRFGSSRAYEQEKAQEKCESEIHQWFDTLSKEQKDDLVNAANNKLSFLKNYLLQPLQEKATILESISTKLGELPSRDSKPLRLKKTFLEPTMGPLFNLKTDNLKKINHALENDVGAEPLKTYMKRYVQIAGSIANGSDESEDRYHELMEDLMRSLSRRNGTGSIQDKFTEAFDNLCNEYEFDRPLLTIPGLNWLKHRLGIPYVAKIDKAVLTNPFTVEAPSAPAAAATAAAPSRSPSRGRMPFKRIASFTILGGIGVVGLGGLVSWIAQGFKPAAPVPTTAHAGAPTPPTPPPANGAAGEALLTRFDEAIKWRSNPGNFGDIPGQGADHPLRALLNLQGKEGLASSNAQISGGTRDELIKLAKAANVDPDKILTAYQTGYNDAYINAYASSANVTFGGNVTESVHAHAMTKSLEAVKAVIEQEHNRQSSLLGRFETLVGNILPKGAPANAAEGPPMMQSSTAPTHGSSSSGVLGQGFGMVSATMATVQLVSTWKNIDNKERLLLAAQATAGALAAAGKTNPALTSALFVANTVRASTAEAYETRTTTLATKQEALQSTLAIQADNMSEKAKKYAAVAWNAFQVTGATVSVVQSVAANGVRDLVRSEENRVVQPMVAEKVGQARDAVVHQASQMLTQAQEVAGNAVASTRENLGSLQHRVAAFFTQRQTAPAL